jgi:hypothetical protein
MIRHIQILCLILILTVGCTPAELQHPSTTATTPPTVTPIPPTETPIPLSDVTGKIFFDRNGSGIMESTEPPIVNFGVCANTDGGEKTCTETDENGEYVFKSFSPIRTQVFISFIDPNVDNPALAFRYINVWNGEKIIPSLEGNGIQIPEQHLHDTDVLPISKGTKASVGTENSIGLMQGFLTMPFPNPTEYSVWTWYDVDSRKGYSSNWKGDNSTSKYDNKVKIFDNHFGIDWLVPDGTFFVAPAPATVVEINLDQDPNAYEGDSILTLYHPSINLYTHYGHLIFSSLAVHEGDKVERGLYIGSTIKVPPSPGDFPFPNMLHGQIQCCRNIQFPLVQSEIFDFYRSENNPSYWTVDNEPQFFP